MGLLLVFLYTKSALTLNNLSTAYYETCLGRLYQGHRDNQAADNTVSS
jgi:hypothetical protein